MKRAKILIVEDELIVSSDIAASVKNYGYDVVGTATTGEDAVKEALRLNPDLVLMDIVLAGEMDGIEAATILHSKYNIPFIYLTASSDKPTLDRAKKTGPYAYITKPFQEQEIFTAIETALYKAEMEARIRENEKWLSAMLNGIGEGIVSIDMNEQITFMNPIAEKLSGYSRDELYGKPWKDYIKIEKSEDSIPDFSLPESYKNVLIVRQTDNFLIRKNGEKVPVDITKSPIVDEKGFISGVVISINDVTERQKSEEIIKKAAHEWKTTFDAITDIVLLLDPNLNILRCNSSVVLKTGRNFDQIIGKNIFEIFELRENLIKAFIDVFSSVKNQNKRKSTEFSVKGNWYTGRIDPISIEGDFFGTVVTVSDITDKKKVEKELEKYREHLEEMVEKRTEELKAANQSLSEEISVRHMVEEQLTQAKEAAETANKSKSEFLANMSHELRTPLNSIIGFAKLMKMGVDEEDFEAYVNSIVSSGNHLLKMINDILDLSKIEAGKIKIIKTDVVVQEVVAEAYEIISIQSDKKNIQLNKIMPEEDVTVYADQKRLRQVLLNLLSNAVKFTPENGIISIEVNKNNRFCNFVISDSGIGIEKDKQEYIFEKFNQIDIGMTKESEGTGLGLSITKNIVEQHQGRIFLDSEPGKGSTFTFTIPLSGNKSDIIDENSIKPGFSYDDDVKKSNVLVLSDDAYELDKFNTFFNYNEQNTLCIKRSEFSSDTMSNNETAIVILSLQNNLDIEKKFLDKIKSLKDVPVIALTRIIAVTESEKILDQGFDSVLLKPINLNEVVNILTKFINGANNG